jgi:quercetin dioxygenase-like cupin family protein
VSEGFVAARIAGELTAPGDGVHWTLATVSDLNANLVRLEPGSAVVAHVNREVDVLFVVLAGGAELTVDGETCALVPYVVAHVPKGSTRALQAGTEGVSYLTVHLRRALQVGPARRQPS